LYGLKNSLPRPFSKAAPKNTTLCFGERHKVLSPVPPGSKTAGVALALGGLYLWNALGAPPPLNWFAAAAGGFHSAMATGLLWSRNRHLKKSPSPEPNEASRLKDPQ
jgi:hypothetical protein